MKKKILILGGNSDIGLELCKLISNYKNIILDIHYNSNLNNLKKINFYSKFIKANFEETNSNDLLKQFRKNYDIIVNLVGFTDNQSFDQFRIHNLQKTIKINSIVPWIIIRNSLNHMVKKKWGRIVNTSSVGVNFGGGINNFDYSISKHLNEFIPQYIRKLYKKNVFYNVVKIGLTNTKIHKKMINKDLKKRIQLVPVNKIANPEDIAKYLLFLISDQNKFITGQVLSITGGE